MLDLRGVVCPGPIVEAKNLLSSMRAGETLKLVSNCPGISDDVADWVKATGFALLATEEVGPRRVRVLHRQAVSATRSALRSRSRARKRTGEPSPALLVRRARGRMRIKSQWFKGAGRRAPRRSPAPPRSSSGGSPQNSLKTMRTARFELAPGPAYFAFLAEFLVFLTLGADRIAHAPRRRSVAGRVHDGDRQPRRRHPRRERGRPSRRRRRAASQAPLRRARSMRARPTTPTTAGPTTAPTTGSCAASAIGCRGDGRARGETWAISQVIECEAPEAADTLRRGDGGPARRDAAAGGHEGSALPPASEARAAARRSAARPFDPDDDRSYRTWRARKLDRYPAAGLPVVELARSARTDRGGARPRSLDAVAAPNMAIYASPLAGEADKEIPRRLGAQLGLARLDAQLARRRRRHQPGDGRRGRPRCDFIPYTNRPIRWHTDGYYNPPARRIRGDGAALRRQRGPRRRERAPRPRDRVSAAARREPGLRPRAACGRTR